MADARHNTVPCLAHWIFPSDYKITFCFAKTRKYSLTLDDFCLSSNWSQIRFFILANAPTCMSEGFWPNFDQINISHRRPCSLWIVNLLTWQKAPEGGYDEKSWEMACNWLMMTSSGDDNRPSGSLGLLTDKTKKTRRLTNVKTALF